MSDPKKGKQRESGGHRSLAEQISSSKATHSDTVENGGLGEGIRDSSAALAALRGANGDDGAIKSIQAVHEFSADSPITLKDVAVAQEDGVSNTADIGEGDIGTSEEVNRTPEGAKEDSNVENNGDSLDEEEGEDDEDEEFDHPGEVSIGKKLWNFLTT